MSDLTTATIARLKEAPAPFKLVDGARAYLSLVVPPIDKMPAAYVLPFAEKYGVNTHMNAVRQNGPETIAIVLMVAVKPGIGADIANPIAAPRAALIARLLGWQPDAADGALLLDEVQLLDAKPTHLSYQFNFYRDHTEKA